MGAVPQLSDGPTAEPGYFLADDFYDEAFDAPGVPRADYLELLAALAQTDLAGLATAISEEVERLGVSFGFGASAQAFHVDPVPRVFAASEWELVERALAQRVRALRSFIADVYGARSIVSAGVVPERAIETSRYFEPWMIGVQVPAWSYLPVAGMDLVRGADGRLWILEDNLRTPSGFAYASAARTAVDPHLPLPAPADRRPFEAAYDTLGAALRSASPRADGDPYVVLLSDGPSNSAWYEHRLLAERLEIHLATPDDLYPSRGRLRVLGETTSREVDVVYRRTDEDRLHDDQSRPTWVAEVLLDPCRSGRLACVNAFGSGVADDKLVHAYVEAMVRFYLHEEPLIPSVPTHDVGVPSVRDSILSRMDEVVVKPRAGHGGHGIVVGPHANAADLERTALRIEADPGTWVAQETVLLSRHPTVDGHALSPRHVDLRAFAISAGDDVEVAAGGLTRFGRDPGALVVNSSQNGGGKDTWVLG
ncbi:MAG TPA: circularly permuted type 2 ATP-grasp protein [Thermoleophilaceae bacterium]|nr:circularly permuted type 2 ATP-grasp protein [Thermoleophilaceae bacterium]